jgi:hypothetical protein
MDEKDLIQQSDEIVQALTKLVMGEKPGFLSNSVFKKLAAHPRLHEMKEVYVLLIQGFKGAYDNASELKNLTDFRYKIIELYNQ